MNAIIPPEPRGTWGAAERDWESQREDIERSDTPARTAFMLGWACGYNYDTAAGTSFRCVICHGEYPAEEGRRLPAPVDHMAAMRCRDSIPCVARMDAAMNAGTW